MMPYMSDDGMSEDSSVVGMPQGRYNSRIVGKERYGITRDSRAVGGYGLTRDSIAGTI